MARKHKPEEIIGKLREAEIVLAQGGTVADGGGTITPSGGTAHWATGHRLRKRQRRHGRPPVPLRSTYGQPWRRRQFYTNKQRGPLGGGRSAISLAPEAGRLMVIGCGDQT